MIFFRQLAFPFSDSENTSYHIVGIYVCIYLFLYFFFGPWDFVPHFLSP